jgi:polyhydroxybutyrate depolymerase
MKNFLLLLIAPFFIQSQCNEGEYELLFETYSGEWAEEITWTILDNNLESIFYYDDSDTENDTWYNQTICLSAGCYAFEANDSYGDGWNEAFVDINAVNNDVDFGVTDLSIELENGFISYTTFQINDAECIYSGVGCTDENANNYNENAFISDDSCDYSCLDGQYILEIETITGDWASEMSWLLYDYQGWNEDSEPITSFQGNNNDQTYNTQICLDEPGCYLILGNDSFGDGWQGGSISIFLDGANILNEITIEDGFDGYFTFELYQKDCFWEFPGCTNSEAINYNPYANIDDGSCIETLIFNFDGLEREYLLHIPNNIVNNAPLVFVLHGYTGSAQGIMDYSGMNEVADENGFVVCYPQGTTDQFDNSFFNVGYEFQNNPTVDDVGFIVALAEYLQDTHQLSTTNTFSTGMSNGGDMSYMLACEASSTFKAIAPVAGMIMENIYESCNPENPVPVFETHGTEDDVTLYEGDPFNDDGWGVYLGIPSTIDFFVTQNNLTDMIFSELPDINPNDGSTIESYIYASPNSNNEVWLYKVIGGGHDWPGAWGNMDVNISEEIWKFFNAMSISEQSFIEQEKEGNKKLIKVIDILGRDLNTKGFNIKIYDDGSVEKKYVVE